MKTFGLAFLLALFSLLSSSCTIKHQADNVIELTEDQWLETPAGKICPEKQMLITPEYIIYFHPECNVRRIVRPKVHPLPRPVPPSIVKQK